MLVTESLLEYSTKCLVCNGDQPLESKFNLGQKQQAFQTFCEYMNLQLDPNCNKAAFPFCEPCSSVVIKLAECHERKVIISREIYKQVATLSVKMIEVADDLTPLDDLRKSAIQCFDVRVQVNRIVPKTSFCSKNKIRIDYPGATELLNFFMKDKYENPEICTGETSEADEEEWRKPKRRRRRLLTVSDGNSTKGTSKVYSDGDLSSSFIEKVPQDETARSGKKKKKYADQDFFKLHRLELGDSIVRYRYFRSFFDQLDEGYRCCTCEVKGRTMLMIKKHCRDAHPEHFKILYKMPKTLEEMEVGTNLYCVNGYGFEKVDDVFKCSTCLSVRSFDKWQSVVCHIHQLHRQRNGDLEKHGITYSKLKSGYRCDKCGIVMTEQEVELHKQRYHVDLLLLQDMRIGPNVHRYGTGKESFKKILARDSDLRNHYKCSCKEVRPTIPSFVEHMCESHNAPWPVKIITTPIQIQGNDKHKLLHLQVKPNMYETLGHTFTKENHKFHCAHCDFSHSDPVKMMAHAKNSHQTSPKERKVHSAELDSEHATRDCTRRDCKYPNPMLDDYSSHPPEENQITSEDNCFSIEDSGIVNAGEQDMPFVKSKESIESAVKLEGSNPDEQLPREKATDSANEVKTENPKQDFKYELRSRRKRKVDKSFEKYYSNEDSEAESIEGSYSPDFDASGSPDLEDENSQGEVADSSVSEGDFPAANNNESDAASQSCTGGTESESKPRGFNQRNNSIVLGSRSEDEHLVEGDREIESKKLKKKTECKSSGTADWGFSSRIVRLNIGDSLVRYKFYGMFFEQVQNGYSCNICKEQSKTFKEIKQHCWRTHPEYCKEGANIKSSKILKEAEVAPNKYQMYSINFDRVQGAFECDVCENPTPFKSWSGMISHINHIHKRTRDDQVIYQDLIFTKNGDGYFCDVCGTQVSNLEMQTHKVMYHTDSLTPEELQEDNKNIYRYQGIVFKRIRSLSQSGCTSWKCVSCEDIQTTLFQMLEHIHLVHEVDPAIKVVSTPIRYHRGTEESQLLDYQVEPNVYEASGIFFRRIGKQFECDSCKTRGSTLNEILSHVSDHQHRNPYNDHFDRIAVDKYVFKSPDPTVYGVTLVGSCFQCDVCGSQRSKLANLKKHFMEIHKANLEVTSVCETCGKGFPSQRVLELHVRATHRQEESTCNICAKTFSSKYSLRTHAKIHDGEGSRVFQCEICGKAFRQNGQLKNHMVTHNRDSQFPCPDCGKVFQYEHTLYIHRSVQHVKKGKKEHSCPECGVMFLHKSSIPRHILVAHRGVNSADVYKRSKTNTPTQDTTPGKRKSKEPAAS